MAKTPQEISALFNALYEAGSDKTRLNNIVKSALQQGYTNAEIKKAAGMSKIAEQSNDQTAKMDTAAQEVLRAWGIL